MEGVKRKRVEIENDIKDNPNPSKKAKCETNKECETFKNETRIPNLQLVCQVCNKAFTLKSNLKKHIASVHEGKTFKCNICTSNFTQKSLKKAHCISS